MENTEIITALVQIQTQFRMLHWQTMTYASHQAFGGIYSSLDETIDEFVEACMGKYGRPKFSGGYQISGEDIDEMDLDTFITQTCDFLISLTETFDPTQDSDLLNLRDEMLGEVNKLKYLLTLK
jgi:hypothetical protein